eukprot:gene7241-7652_t
MPEEWKVVGSNSNNSNKHPQSNFQQPSLREQAFELLQERKHSQSQDSVPSKESPHKSGTPKPQKDKKKLTTKNGSKSNRRRHNSNDNKISRKQTISLEDAVRSLDSGHFEASLYTSKVDFPDKPEEHLKQAIDRLTVDLSHGKSDIRNGNPLKYCPKHIIDIFHEELAQHNTALLTKYFRVVISQLIKKNMQGKQLLGEQLVIQLFLKWEIDHKKEASGMLYHAYQDVAVEFKQQYPDPKIVLPLLWIFNLVATTLSGTYFLVWKVLILPLMFDPKSLGKVKSACVRGMTQLLPQDHEQCMSRIKVLCTRAAASTQLSPQQIFMLIDTAFSTKREFKQQLELQRQYRYLRNFALQSHASCREILQHLTVAAITIPKSEPAVQHQLLELASLAFLLEPRVAIPGLLKTFDKPAACVVFLQHLLASKRFPRQEVAKTFVDAISTVENAANERIPSSNGKIKNSPWSVISSLCKEIKQAALSREAIIKSDGVSLNRRSCDPVSFILLSLMAICFVILIFLGAFVFCETRENKAPVVLHFCNTLTSMGVFERVQLLLDRTFPVAQRVEPYFSDIFNYALRYLPTIQAATRNFSEKLQPYFEEIGTHTVKGLSIAGKKYFPFQANLQQMGGSWIVFLRQYIEDTRLLSFDFHTDMTTLCWDKTWQWKRSIYFCGKNVGMHLVILFRVKS